MKMRQVFLFILSLSFTFSSIAQILPNDRAVNWSYALPGNIVVPSLVKNIKTDFGAIGDGVSNDDQAFSNAFQFFNGQPGVLYIPSGNYLLSHTLNLPDNLLIKGESSSSTQLNFNLNGTGSHCIYIGKFQASSFVPITGGYAKGSNQVSVSNTSLFSINGYVEIREANGSWDTNPLPESAYSVGQIAKITGISGNTLSLEHGLRTDYTSGLHPEIRPISMANNVGIECISINRQDDAPAQVAYNISFNYATLCWVKGVESKKSVGSHFAADYSTNITIDGCYIHDAFSYTGQATAGYGVTLRQHTGECLIENNIFRHLRHSFVVKEGANGNVFAYNYSYEPNRSESPANFGADIMLLGHYPFANLFEGNIVQNIQISQTYGIAGPFNTFLRNRAELYGFIMSSASDSQNIIGLEITGAGFLFGQYVLMGNNLLEYGNNVKGVMHPNPITSLPDNSYYLTQAPDFWSSSIPWPSIGFPATLGSGTIPAKLRATTTICSVYPPSTAPVFSVVHNLICAPNSNVAYKILPVPFATSYNWQVPPGAIIVSGQGTDSLTVSFSDSSSSGNITVVPSNSAGNGPTSSVFISTAVTVPGIPGSITGDTSVCPGKQLVPYSIEPILRATDYTWTASGGCSIQSGQGTNSILVDFQSDTVSTLQVKGVNACGEGGSASINIIPKNIGATGSITGLDKICPNEINVRYSIAPVPRATVYTWNIPTGAEIVSGQGTNSVIINYSGQFSGNISVTPSNECLAGSTSYLTITHNTSVPVFLEPGISGPDGVCPSNTALFKAMVDGATSYTWNGGEGSNIYTNEYTTSIYWCGEGIRRLTIKASNACGSSSWSKDVTVSPRVGHCEPMLVDPCGTYSKFKAATLIYGDGQNHIFIKSSEEPKSIIIYDVLGRRLQFKNQHLSKTLSNVELLNKPHGLYFVRIMGSKKVIVQTIVL